MTKNGDKPGKLSALEKRGQEKRSWERLLKAQYLSRPLAITWIINLVSGFLVLLVISQPEGKLSRNVYNRPENEGEPVIAIRDLKIPRDLEVPDVEGTEKKKAFAASRKCPTTWLIEKDPQKAPAGQGSPNRPPEFTVYLEEDCPNQVVYYVFMDQSNMNPQQWLEWRQSLHKSKANPMFASAKAKLERACQDGCEVSAELRFIQKNGELLAKSPEKFLQGDLKFAPIYDLNQQKKISK